LNCPGIDESACLSCKVSGGESSQITLFQTNYSGIAYIGDDLNEVVSPKIQKLAKQGYNLLALASNAKALHPYTETTDITLQVQVNVTEEPQVTGCLFQTGNIEANVVMENSDGSTTESSGWYSDNFFSHTSDPTTITTYENYEYKSSFDYTANDGIHYSGTHSVTFDKDFKNIVSFSINRKMVYEPTKPWGYTKESSLSEHDIPIDPYNTNNIWFKVKGSETCNKIDNMSYSYITTGYCSFAQNRLKYS
jgi:hypothetical protein